MTGMDKKWSHQSQISRQSNPPLSTVQIISHKPEYFTSGTSFELFCMLYIDYGAFMFESRRYLEKCLFLTFTHFSKFRLEMYICRRLKPPKARCILFPPLILFKLPWTPYTAVKINSSQVSVPAKKYN